MQKEKDQRPRSSKPTTIHGFAQSGDINSFRKLLRENPSLLNERNPVVRSPLFPPFSLSCSSYLNLFISSYFSDIVICSFELKTR